MVGLLCNNREMFLWVLQNAFRNFRYIWHCGGRNYHCQTGVHIIASRLLPLPFQGVCRVLGQDLQAHVYGQLWPELRDQSQQNSNSHISIPHPTDRDTEISSVQMISGRRIKDSNPILPVSYRPHNAWIETLRAMEEATRSRIVKILNSSPNTRHCCNRLKFLTKSLSRTKKVIVHCDGIPLSW